MKLVLAFSKRLLKVKLMDITDQILVQISNKPVLADNEFDLLRRHFQSLRPEASELLHHVLCSPALSTKRGRSVYPGKPQSLDCQSCGACCSFYFVPLEKADRHFKTEHATDVFQANDISVIRRNQETGNCNQLNGEIGIQTACKTYANRPHNCREYEAGSDACLALRQLYGIDSPMPENSLDGWGLLLDARVVELTKP